MLDYFHSNSVNGDLDINTIMIVPCGVFVSTILFGFFSLSLYYWVSSSKRNHSPDSSFQGGKQDSNTLFKGRELPVIRGFHMNQKNVDNMIPRNMI